MQNRFTFMKELAFNFINIYIYEFEFNFIYMYINFPQINVIMLYMTILVSFELITVAS